MTGGASSWETLLEIKGNHSRDMEKEKVTPAIEEETSSVALAYEYGRKSWELRRVSAWMAVKRKYYLEKRTEARQRSKPGAEQEGKKKKPIGWGAGAQT